jgi:tungstate transport system substrate-binding protein
VLRLATTTSTEDSGLLDAILPEFEEERDATVEVVAVGTGQALELGESGDADVVLVHARAQEDAFVEAGDGVDRRDVMYNDFVLVGPKADPAGVAGIDDVTAAFAQIADSKAMFISRGDESGTHTRELALWEAAGVEPSGSWYQAIGQGMGETLTVAEEQQAYTLSDRATYLARVEEGLSLSVVSEGDERLLNPYGVIAVNPERHEGVNSDLAEEFIDWLTSPSTQDLIEGFRIGGEQVFFVSGTA